MLKISIPTPCHEDWDAMIPNTQGRHCNSCVKTVVDFTNMSDEEVKHFFINKKEEKVCGRFRSEQLHRITIELPHNIFYLRIPFWKKFLAASLLVFSATLFSCDATLKGEMVDGKVEITHSEAMGKPLAPQVKDTLTTIQQPVCTPTLGTPSVVVGAIQPPPMNEVGLIEIVDSLQLDKAVTNKYPAEMGEVQMVVKDPLPIKKNIKTNKDSCNNQQFY